MAQEAVSLTSPPFSPITIRAEGQAGSELEGTCSVISHTPVGPSPGHSGWGLPRQSEEIKHGTEESRKQPGHLSWRHFLLVVSGDRAPSLVLPLSVPG